MRPKSLLSNSLALSIARLLPMVLGFGSWLVAARAYPAVEVGLASAAVAAALLGIQVALLGLGTATVSLLAVESRPRDFLDTAVSALVIAAVTVSGLLLVLSHVTDAESSRAAASPLHAALFSVLVLAGTLALYVDHVFVALLRADQAVVRGLVHSLVVLGGVLLGAWSGVGSGLTVILGAWAAGAAISLAVGLRQIRRSTLAHVPVPRRLELPRMQELVKRGGPHHLANLTERAPGLLLPILVTEMLSPEQNAAWYAVWMIVTGVYLVPASVGLALQAHVASASSIRAAVGHALRYAAGLGAGTAAGVLLIGSVLLSLLGEVYASASGALWVLLPAVFPVAVVQVYLGLCRAAGRLREAVVLNAVSAVAVLASAAVGGAAFELVGVAAAWSTVQVLSACWCWRRLSVLEAVVRTATERAAISGGVRLPVDAVTKPA